MNGKEPQSSLAQLSKRCFTGACLRSRSLRAKQQQQRPALRHPIIWMNGTFISSFPLPGNSATFSPIPRLKHISPGIIEI